MCNAKPSHRIDQFPPKFLCPIIVTFDEKRNENEVLNTLRNDLVSNCTYFAAFADCLGQTALFCWSILSTGRDGQLKIFLERRCRRGLVVPGGRTVAGNLSEFINSVACIVFFPFHEETWFPGRDRCTIRKTRSEVGKPASRWFAKNRLR